MNKTHQKSVDSLQALNDDNLLPTGIYTPGEIKLKLSTHLQMPEIYIGDVIGLLHKSEKWSHNGIASRLSRWSKNGAPFQVKHEPNPLPFEKEDGQDRMKERVTGIMRDTGQICKGMATLNERMANVEKLLCGICEDNGNVSGQLDSILASLDVISKRVRHLDAELSSAPTDSKS